MDLSTKQKEKKSQFYGLPSIILPVIIIGILGVALIRENSDKLFPVPPVEKNTADIENWVKAIENGNNKKAVILASRIFPDNTPKLPDSDYLQTALNMKFSTVLFTQFFNERDYLGWKDAFEFKKIADKLKKEEKNSAKDIFKLVRSRVKYAKPDEKTVPLENILDIWNRGTGSYTEMTRVLCMLAKQAGYKPMVVYLLDKENNKKHIICELRKGNEISVIDLRYEKIWQGKSALDIGLSDVSDIWPEEFQFYLNKKLYEFPAELIEYRIYNHKLRKIIEKSNYKNLPVFGKDPKTGIKSFLEGIPADTSPPPVTYWSFPLFSIISQPDFPEDLRL
jgi:hypothetical protein